MGADGEARDFGRPQGVRREHPRRGCDRRTTKRVGKRSATLKGLRHSVPSCASITKINYPPLSCLIVFYRVLPVGNSALRTSNSAFEGVQAPLAFAPFARNNPAFLCVSTSRIFTMGVGSACSQFIIFLDFLFRPEIIRPASLPTPSLRLYSPLRPAVCQILTKKKSFPWCLCVLVVRPVCSPSVKSVQSVADYFRPSS